MPVPAHQAHHAPVLVREHAPAVVFLLVNPARVMEGARYERWLHERDGGKGHSSARYEEPRRDIAATTWADAIAHLTATADTLTAILTTAGVAMPTVGP